MICFEELERLLSATRSYRRFDQSKEIAVETLEKLVGLTRYCPSGRNLQPLKYACVCDPVTNGKIFPLLKWAGYLTDWDGPEDGERPAAYIVQCLDTELTESLLCDDGLELEAIMLGATASGLGGCIIKSFDAVKLTGELGLDSRFRPLYVVALGYPTEEVLIRDASEGNGSDIRYYRDGLKHYVPKRVLKERLIPIAGR